MTSAAVRTRQPLPSSSATSSPSDVVQAQRQLEWHLRELRQRDVLEEAPSLAVRVPLPSPSSIHSSLDQLETVVKTSAGSSPAYGHCSTLTGGRMWIQSKPHDGNLASGVPTVSPVVK